MNTPPEDERGGLPRDLTKRILTLGLGAYFLTEDTVRRYVKDAKLPRDIGKTITHNAVKGKEELYGFVARELSDFLRQMDLQEEMGRFLRKHTIRVNAEIEFLPRAGAESEAGEEEDAGPLDLNLRFKTSSSAEDDESPPAEEAPEEPEEQPEGDPAPVENPG